MRTHRRIFSTTPIFEADFAAFESSTAPQKEPVTINGFHSKLDFFMNNMHILQRRYAREVGDKEAILKEVDFVDIAPFIFRSKNKINYRFWKSHLREIGKAITFCNPDITPFEIKNALLRVYQRNILIPQKLKPTPETWKSYHLNLSHDLDVIVNQSIAEVPTKGRKNCNKIIFHPDNKLTSKEKRQVASRLTPNNKRQKTLYKLKKKYKAGMTQKELMQETGVSRSTIIRYWQNIKAA